MELSYIRLTVQGAWFGVGAPGLRLLVDGHPVEVDGVEVQDVPVSPGRHDLELSVWWLRRHGHASIEVEVAPAQVVEVFYAPPHDILARGAIGERKQRHRGMAGLVVLLGGMLLATSLVTFLLR